MCNNVLRSVLDSIVIRTRINPVNNQLNLVSFQPRSTKRHFPLHNLLDQFALVRITSNNDSAVFPSLLEGIIRPEFDAVRSPSDVAPRQCTSTREDKQNILLKRGDGSASTHRIVVHQPQFVVWTNRIDRIVFSITTSPYANRKAHDAGTAFLPLFDSCTNLICSLD